MKLNELKDAYFELKDVKNALKMKILPEARKKSLENKQKQLNKTLGKYKNFFSVDAPDLKKALDDYFKSKNAQAETEFGYYSSDSYDYSGYYEATYYDPLIKINYKGKSYSIQIPITFNVKTKYFSETEYNALNFKTNVYNILEDFFHSPNLAELYKDFDDILDVFWDLVAENVKRINQQKIEAINAQQQEKRNMIVELTDQTIIAKKVEKIEGEILELENKKAKCTDDELDIVIATTTKTD